jgi:hypothetical protein
MRQVDVVNLEVGENGCWGTVEHCRDTDRAPGEGARTRMLGFG